MLLEEFLKPSGTKHVEAAACMGVPFQRMNTLVKGTRGVTADWPRGTRADRQRQATLTIQPPPGTAPLGGHRFFRRSASRRAARPQNLARRRPKSWVDS